jgi:hypothetical protein
MGETSIPCREETRDRLRDDKTSGVSWDRYLNDLLDAEERADDHENAGDVDGFSSLASSVESIEGRIGTIERKLDDMEARSR